MLRKLLSLFQIHRPVFVVTVFDRDKEQTKDIEVFGSYEAADTEYKRLRQVWGERGLVTMASRMER